MEVEIFLDLEKADPAALQLIDTKLREWYAEGAEVRYDKLCYGSMRVLEDRKRFQVDLGQVNPVTAIRELHARLVRYGVKVFVHFFS